MCTSKNREHSIQIADSYWQLYVKILDTIARPSLENSGNNDPLWSRRRSTLVANKIRPIQYLLIECAMYPFSGLFYWSSWARIFQQFSHSMKQAWSELIFQQQKGKHNIKNINMNEGICLHPANPSLIRTLHRNSNQHLNIWINLTFLCILNNFF